MLQPFADTIKDDYLIFDNLRSITVIHRYRDATSIDWSARKTVTADTQFVVNNCLFRYTADRNTQPANKIIVRMTDAHNENHLKQDTVCEIPKVELPPGSDVSEGDEVIDSKNGVKYMVLAVDRVTLDTRIRVGLSANA
jgi:predicted small metal-binding protein